MVRQAFSLDFKTTKKQKIQIPELKHNACHHDFMDEIQTTQNETIIWPPNEKQSTQTAQPIKQLFVCSLTI